MGAPYEFNWYLVVANKDAIKEIEKNKYSTLKAENRIYPINSEIPLIIKKVGCIGIVRVLRISIDKDNTEIDFEYAFELDSNSEIAQHYYNMYLDMKNK